MLVNFNHLLPVRTTFGTFLDFGFLWMGILYIVTYLGLTIIQFKTGIKLLWDTGCIGDYTNNTALHPAWWPFIDQHVHLQGQCSWSEAEDWTNNSQWLFPKKYEYIQVHFHAFVFQFIKLLIDCVTALPTSCSLFNNVTRQSILGSVCLTM